MSGPLEVKPGFFDYASLKPAANAQLQSFRTSGWAGLAVLFVATAAGEYQYPWFFDTFKGYSRHYPAHVRDHSLHVVEKALRQATQEEQQSPLRSLSFQVGQIAARELSDRKPAAWERKEIAKSYYQLGDTNLEEPNAKWRWADFAAYYDQIRSLEADNLCTEIIRLAGIVATQNKEVQLYVARQSTARAGSGWLAPLIGLAIDPVIEDYYHQVHDVVPVVAQQADETPGLLHDADANIYTIYTP